MDKHLKTILINILLSASVLHAAQILAIFPVYSKSHHSINQPIIRELVKRGHNVTIISPFISNTRSLNYKEIVIKNDLFSFVDNISIDDVHLFNGVPNVLFPIADLEHSSCLKVLKTDFIRGLIQSKKKCVDLILSEEYFTQCYNLLAEQLDVPVIAISPSTSGIGTDLMIGNPGNPATVPIMTTSYTTHMGFFQRIMNTYQFLCYYIGHYFLFNSNMEELAKTYFNSRLQSLGMLHQRVALTFYNNHFSLITKAAVPNAIDIGGIHIQNAKVLPEYIKNFIDEAEHGVIFFSFGTAIKVSSISIDKIEMIKRVLSRIPQRILWRVDKPQITSLPANVLADKWYPQRDILEHKNVIAFISHCGVFSTMEAIYTATPVIAIPFFFDQHQNAEILVKKGMAIHVNYDTLTEATLSSTIIEIINNTKYHENAERASKIFKERPISPLNTAIFWLEYILRHSGAPQIRPLSADMPLYQYLLLDVIVFFSTITVIIVWSLKRVLQIILAHL